MEFRDVFIEKRSFKTMIFSAIEVYNRETNGALLGRNAVRKIRGVEKKVVSIKDVYPFQTDRRKPTEVEHGNISAFKRLIEAVESMKTEIIGGYHSHPYPYGYVGLSEGDVISIADEIKMMSKYGQTRVENGWIEVLLSITKKYYSRPKKKGWYISDRGKRLRCIIRVEDRIGFDIIISAYWVYPKNVNGKKIKYGVKEVGVYTYWILD